LLAPAPALFLLRHTTIIPHADAKTLITGGPYRFTRNPMYLALTIGYVGAALAMNALGPLLLLSVPLWVLEKKTIPFEEANLTRIFGDEYRAYQQRVRRWI
jgi:protein-S-isoprenylcysteine O-methyltransferase Ste14